MDDKETSELLKYLHEIGQMRFVKRSGWWVAKIRDPESVAEHSFRTAVIAYILAKLEGHPNPEKLVVKSLFHDVLEARLLDRHKISSNYLKTPPEVERLIEKEQASRLPGKMGNDMMALLADEDVIAKDADYLDVALAGREYYDAGYKDAWDWVVRPGLRLRTKSAKKLHAKLLKSDSGAWWKGLKEKVK